MHLDHMESHRCRVILDEELGENNFVAEVAWQKADSPRNDTRLLSTSQDTILVYRKSEAWTPNRMSRLAASNTNRYQSRDGDAVPWRDGDATAGKAATNHPMVYAIQHPITGGLMYPTAGRSWGKAQSWFLEQMSEYAPYELRDIGDEATRARICGTTPDKVKAGVPAIMLSVPLEEAAVLARKRYDAGYWPDVVMLGLREKIQRKKYLEDNGRVPETLWLGSEVGGNLRGKNEIKALFPDEHPFSTPKPEALLARIIHIGSNPGDIVLDVFAGSGTTAAVAHKMGRRWVTSELKPETVSRYTLPRLTKVVNGQDPGGVTAVIERVAATDENEDGERTLPEGMTPQEAQEFNRLLTKVVKSVKSQLTEAARPSLDQESPGGACDDRSLGVESALPQEGPESLDESSIKLLRAATKTRDERTTLWHGGGGFSHLVVGDSMFVQMAGITLLADWAVQGALAEAMCAQLSVPYDPDGIFAAKQGRVRYVVIDGMVGSGTVAAILDRLVEDELVEVWATQIEDGAAEALSAARSGSRLSLIPHKVLDNYRRKSSRKSPFGAGRSALPSQRSDGDDTVAPTPVSEGESA